MYSNADRVRAVEHSATNHLDCVAKIQKNKKSIYNNGLA